MTAASVEPRSWSPLKWAVVAACILAAQAGFFYWFARPPGLVPRPRPEGLAIVMPGGHPADVPGSINPLILVRPDAHGFSGRAWLQIPPVTNNLQEFDPSNYLLPPQTNRLGAAITESLSNDLSRHFEVVIMPGPRDDMNYYPNPAAPALESTLTSEGRLAGRPLLKPPVLKPQPADTIVSNSVVLVVVDAGGRVFAPPVLATMAPAGTANSADGQAIADAQALAIAANLLFQPQARVPGQSRPDSLGLTPGRLVFHWQTIPKPAPTTNDPPITRGQ